jgi:hypothetical protein
MFRTIGSAITLFEDLPSSIKKNLNADQCNDYRKVNAVALVSIRYVLGYIGHVKFADYLNELKIIGCIPKNDIFIWHTIMDFWYERGGFKELAEDVKISIRELVSRDTKLHSKSQLSAVYAFHIGQNDCAEDLNRSLRKVVAVFSEDCFNKSGTLRGDMKACLYCKLEEFSFELLKCVSDEGNIWEVDSFGYLVYKTKKNQKCKNRVCEM